MKNKKVQLGIVALVVILLVSAFIIPQINKKKIAQHYADMNELVMGTLDYTYLDNGDGFEKTNYLVDKDVKEIYDELLVKREEMITSGDLKGLQNWKDELVETVIVPNEKAIVTNKIKAVKKDIKDNKKLVEQPDHKATKGEKDDLDKKIKAFDTKLDELETKLVALDEEVTVETVKITNEVFTIKDYKEEKVTDKKTKKEKTEIKVELDKFKDHKDYVENGLGKKAFKTNLDKVTKDNFKDFMVVKTVVTTDMTKQLKAETTQKKIVELTKDIDAHLKKANERMKTAQEKTDQERAEEATRQAAAAAQEAANQQGGYGGYGGYGGEGQGSQGGQGGQGGQGNPGGPSITDPGIPDDVDDCIPTDGSGACW